MAMPGREVTPAGVMGGQQPAPARAAAAFGGGRGPRRHKALVIAAGTTAHYLSQEGEVCHLNALHLRPITKMTINVVFPQLK